MCFVISVLNCGARWKVIRSSSSRSSYSYWGNQCVAKWFEIIINHKNWWIQFSWWHLRTIWRSPVSRILSHHPLETTNVCINVISIHPVHHIFSLDWHGRQTLHCIGLLQDSTESSYAAGWLPFFCCSKCTLLLPINQLAFRMWITYNRAQPARLRPKTGYQRFLVPCQLCLSRLPRDKHNRQIHVTQDSS